MDFEKIYRAYFGDVYRYLLKLTGDEHTAEELTAETFWRAIKNLDRFRGESELRVWLCGIGKNCWKDMLRRQNRECPLEIGDDAPSDTDIERELDEREDTRQIYRLLNALPEPYREVFSLRVLGELGFSEIGRLFGKTANWACVTYHRAKEKIRAGMMTDTEQKQKPRH